MAQTASAVTFGASLIEDYLQIEIPPVADDLTAKFVAVQNVVNSQPIAELLTVGSDNQTVLHFQRDPTSHSGWSQTAVPVANPPAANVDKLVAFYEAGVLNLLVHYPAQQGAGSAVIWMQRSTAGAWAPIPFDPELANALGQTTQTDFYQDPSGKHYLYGISANYVEPSFFLASLDEASGSWTVNFLMPAASSTAAYLVLIGYGANQLSILWLDGSQVTYRGGSIVNGMFQWGDAGGSFNLQQGSLSITQLYALPAAAGQSAFILLGNDAQLYYVSGYNTPSPTGNLLTGLANQPQGVDAVALGLDSQNLYMVFAVDTTNQQLWLLRQTGTDSNGNALFGNWVLLGDTLAAVACPTLMTLGPEVFAVSVARDLQHLNQNLPDLTWFTRQLAAPTPSTQTPQHLSTYTTEIVAVDNNGSPVPSTVMNVTADRPTVVIANGLSYHIDPNTPAQVVSDGLGKVTIAIQAMGITAPVLQVNVPAYMSAGQTISCPGDLAVCNRLAGNDPTFPVTGDALMSAGLMPQDFDPTSANQIAGAIRSVGQAMVAQRNAQASGALDLSRIEVPHWELDFTTAKRPTFRRLTREEAQAYMQTRAALGATSVFSDFWGDVAHFFKNVISALEKIVITVLDDISVVINDVKTFVVKTVDQLKDALEVVFQKIAEGFEEAIDAIEKAIEWLRLLFEWSDIVNTHEVVKYYINAVLTNMANTVDGGLVGFVEAKFSALQTKITNAFDSAEQVFAEGISFNQFANSLPRASGSTNGNALQGQPYQDAYHADRVRCNYVSSKAHTYYTNQASAAAALALPGDSSPFDNLVALIQAQVTQFEASTQKLQNFLHVQTSDPKAFFDLVILDFLEVAKDVIIFVLDVVEDIIVALLDLLGSAIQGLRTTLNATIDIPIISWLYKQISGGDDLSILDLLSLILAVPATLLYKVLFGGSQASPPFTDAAVTTITSTPIPWPTLDSTAATPSAAMTSATAAGRLSASDISPTQEILGTLAGIAYFLYAAADIANDAGAAASQNDPEPDPFATFLSWSSIILTVAIQGFTVPYAVIAKPSSQRTTADTATLALWGVGFLPVAIDTAATALGTQKALAKYMPAVGPIAASLAAAPVLGTGIWTTVEQALDATHAYNGWTQAGNIIAPIPGTFSFLLALADATDYISVIFLFAIAALCDIGATVTTIVGNLS